VISEITDGFNYVFGKHSHLNLFGKIVIGPFVFFVFIVGVIVSFIFGKKG